MLYSPSFSFSMPLGTLEARVRVISSGLPPSIVEYLIPEKTLTERASLLAGGGVLLDRLHHY